MTRDSLSSQVSRWKILLLEMRGSTSITLLGGAVVGIKHQLWNMRKENVPELNSPIFNICFFSENQLALNCRR
jgi:hypothetical protein